VAPIGAQLSEFASRPRKEAIERLRNGETQADIARTYGVDATTLGCVGCSFQLGRTSILLPRLRHLPNARAERRHLGQSEANEKSASAPVFLTFRWIVR
jgi:hypothetical protein